MSTLSFNPNKEKFRSLTGAMARRIQIEEAHQKTLLAPSILGQK